MNSNKKNTVNDNVAKKSSSKGDFFDPFKEEPVAHSSDIEKGIYFTQRYSAHIENVKIRSLKTFDELSIYLNYSDNFKKALREILEIAAEYHDLGKLDKLVQETILNGHNRKMLNHVDAGVSYLLYMYEKEGKKGLNYLWAALIIDAHHIGLISKYANPEAEKESRIPLSLIGILNNVNVLRDNKKIIPKYFYYKDVLNNKDETVKEYVDRNMSYFIQEHRKWVKNSKETIESDVIPLAGHPMLFRLLMSCLVEGDHWDTSRHYGNVSPNQITLPIKSEQRLEQYLSKYNNFSLGEINSEKKKNKVRRMIHKDCEEIKLDNDFYGLYAYPSFGKTFSGAMCLPLRLCKEHELRGYVYAAPFNNILCQNIEKMEENLIIDGEKKTEVIGEHHQEAIHYNRSKGDDISYKLIKHYGTNWQCPIEIVSDVQLFETIAGNFPFKLRKLNQLVGRVIVLDEFHTMVPAKLIRQTIKWLKYMVDYWGCKVIFMSGSPIRFWDIEELKSCDIKVKEVLSENSFKEMKKIDKRRVQYKYLRRKFKSFDKLIKKVKEKEGPRLVVFNTILSASIFANMWRKKYGIKSVKHLSTALDPENRKKIYKEILDKLKEDDNDWVLVATSCVDTGVNFSFKTGFRENCSLLSSLQMGGRVNRENEYKGKCDVFIFNMDYNYCGGTENPTYLPSIRVQNKMARENIIDYENCTEAVQRELIEKNIDKDNEKIKKIEKFENSLCYKGVAENYSIIAHAYKSVIVDPLIIENIKNGICPEYHQIKNNSVQIFFTKLDRLEYKTHIKTIDKSEEVIENSINSIQNESFDVWTGEYDPNFLGYMKEVLKYLKYDVNY